MNNSLDVASRPPETPLIPKNVKHAMRGPPITPSCSLSAKTASSRESQAGLKQRGWRRFAPGPGEGGRARDRGLKGNIAPRDDAARRWTLVIHFERPREEATRIPPLLLPSPRRLHPTTM